MSDTTIFTILTGDGKTVQEPQALPPGDTLSILTHLIGAPGHTEARVRPVTDEAVEIEYPGVLEHTTVTIDTDTTRHSFAAPTDNTPCIYRFTLGEGRLFESVREWVRATARDFPCISTQQ